MPGTGICGAMSKLKSPLASAVRCSLTSFSARPILPTTAATPTTSASIWAKGAVLPRTVTRPPAGGVPRSSVTRGLVRDRRRARIGQHLVAREVAADRLAVGLQRRDDRHAASHLVEPRQRVAALVVARRGFAHRDRIGHVLDREAG